MFSYACSAPQLSATWRDRSGLEAITPTIRAPARIAARRCTPPIIPAPRIATRFAVSASWKDYGAQPVTAPGLPMHQANAPAAATWAHIEYPTNPSLSSTRHALFVLNSDRCEFLASSWRTADLPPSGRHNWRS